MIAKTTLGNMTFGLCLLGIVCVHSGCAVGSEKYTRLLDEMAASTTGIWEEPGLQPSPHPAHQNGDDIVGRDYWRQGYQQGVLKRREGETDDIAVMVARFAELNHKARSLGFGVPPLGYHLYAPWRVLGEESQFTGDTEFCFDFDAGSSFQSRGCDEPHGMRFVTMSLTYFHKEDQRAWFSWHVLLDRSRHIAFLRSHYMFSTFGDSMGDLDIRVRRATQ